MTPVTQIMICFRRYNLLQRMSVLILAGACCVPAGSQHCCELAQGAE